MDNKTIYIISIAQNNFENMNKNIVMEICLRTPVGLFRNIKLKDLKIGIYNIKV